MRKMRPTGPGVCGLISEFTIVQGFVLYYRRTQVWFKCGHGTSKGSRPFEPVRCVFGPFHSWQPRELEVKRGRPLLDLLGTDWFIVWFWSIQPAIGNLRSYQTTSQLHPRIPLSLSTQTWPYGRLAVGLSSYSCSRTKYLFMYQMHRVVLISG
jgi:hypothetical protein